jgi:hypothetical protein
MFFFVLIQKSTKKNQGKNNASGRFAGPSPRDQHDAANSTF